MCFVIGLIVLCLIVVVMVLGIGVLILGSVGLLFYVSVMDFLVFVMGVFGVVNFIGCIVWVFCNVGFVVGVLGVCSLMCLGVVCVLGMVFSYMNGLLWCICFVVVISGLMV